jgi:TniQ
MTRVMLPATPLPRPVSPFPGELLSSYLRRLAHANRLDAAALRRFASGGARERLVSLSRLAIISGTPAAALERALGDLDGDKSKTFCIR